MPSCGVRESALWERCSTGLVDRVVKLRSKRRARAGAAALMGVYNQLLGLHEDWRLKEVDQLTKKHQIGL
jgi:hypothetical protein